MDTIFAFSKVGVYKVLQLRCLKFSGARVSWTLPFVSRYTEGVFQRKLIIMGMTFKIYVNTDAGRGWG